MSSNKKPCGIGTFGDWIPKNCEACTFHHTGDEYKIYSVADGMRKEVDLFGKVCDSCPNNAKRKEEDVKRGWMILAGLKAAQEYCAGQDDCEMCFFHLGFKRLTGLHDCVLRPAQ